MAIPKVSSLGFYDTTTVSTLGFFDENFSSSGAAAATKFIKHGSDTVSAVYHGSTQITKVYVGTTQVFPAN